ncbi:MAG: hypothetical protein GX419_00110 [Bacteroidales bacterium]|nr:hypothetical protein [Bacteroidales bacterium]
MNNGKKKFLYLVLTFLTVATGYAFIRLAYNVSDSFPFTQEIVLIFLGTIATIFITALLLNKQTSVELEKEQNIRYFELKTQTYQQLLDLLEEMSLVKGFSENEIIRLQFITHKLAVIASAEVLREYQSMLHTIKQLSVDNSFVGDMPLLHSSLARLTLEIRKDILGKNSLQNKGFTQERINEIIIQNSEEELTN